MRREPSLIIATIGAVLSLVAGFGLPFLSADQAGLITAVITAGLGIWTALKVRPVAPAVFTYGTGLVATLLATYGVDLSQERVALINAAVLAVLTMVLRGQVSPVGTVPEAVTYRTGGPVAR